MPELGQGGGMKKIACALIGAVLLPVVASSSAAPLAADTPRQLPLSSSISGLSSAAEGGEDVGGEDMRLHRAIANYHLRRGHEFNPRLVALAEEWLRQALMKQISFDDWDQSLVHDESGEVVGYVTRQHLRHVDASVARLEGKHLPGEPELRQVGVATGRDGEYVYAVETFLEAEQ